MSPANVATNKQRPQVRPPVQRKGQARQGGRKKGTPNKATVEIRTAAKALIEDRKYITALKRRLKDGKAPHMEPILFYYAYGKPRERMELSGPEGTPLGYDLSKLSLPQLRQLAVLLGPAAVVPTDTTFKADPDDERPGR